MFILLLHVEIVKARQGGQAVKWIAHFIPLGGLAVSLFFVLSGFLITYLLLKEKEKTSAINLKGFYFKRIVRIWPLYFLIGLLGFIFLPMLGSFSSEFFYRLGRWHWASLAIYFLFIPSIFKDPLSIGAAWSVRVEEAFYLLWPVLLSRVKNYYSILIWTVMIVIMARNGSDYFFRMNPESTALRILFNQALNYRVSCMAIGGLGAYLFLEGKQNILSVIYRKDFQWALYIVTAALLFFRVHVRFVHFEFYSVLFTCIIVNLAANPLSIVKLDYKWINYLGRVSYGIYLYNPIMVVFCLVFVKYLFGNDTAGWQANMVLYASTIISTIILSVLSFELFEKKFLGLKKKLAA